MLKKKITNKGLSQKGDKINITKLFITLGFIFLETPNLKIIEWKCKSSASKGFFFSKQIFLINEKRSSNDG